MSVLRRLVWRILPPYEISVVSDRIREFVEGAGRGVVPEEFLGRALSRARREQTVLAIRLEQVRPDHVAYRIIASVFEQLLTSGQYHIYRGILSADGHTLLAQWQRCAAEAKARGFLTDAEEHSALEALRTSIARIG